MKLVANPRIYDSKVSNSDPPPQARQGAHYKVTHASNGISKFCPPRVVASHNLLGLCTQRFRNSVAGFCVIPSDSGCQIQGSRPENRKINACVASAAAVDRQWAPWQQLLWAAQPKSMSTTSTTAANWTDGRTLLRAP